MYLTLKVVYYRKRCRRTLTGCLHMTYYDNEIKKIRAVVYSNKGQIDIVIALRKYICQHFDQDLNLDLLSKKQYVSKFHLLRVFKRYYGQTPHQFLTDKRIEQSKELLKKGVPVNKAGFAVGFESASSFSTLFKNKTGLPPAIFQKKQLSQRVVK